MDDARGWRWRDFFCKNWKQDSKPFFKCERKIVSWVLNHKMEIYVMEHYERVLEKVYIYVGDLAQK